MSEKKHYPDYIEAHLKPKSGKWVSDHIVKGRRLALYGIDVAISSDKRGKAELSPIIPYMSGLMRLIKKYPKAEQFQWNQKKLKWMLA